MSLPAGASQVRRVGGGDINETFRVVLADGREAFVKTRADAPRGEYAAEAEGLQWLAEPGALRTPRVLELSDGHLALEWIEPGALSVDGAEQLGRGLADTHLAGAPVFGTRGPGASGFGWLRLSNGPAADWASFYAERRLAPMTRISAERGVFSPAGVRALERVCERLPALLGPAERPARLHGDLWGGNVMADPAGRPWLIDPAAYGGHREVDLAMLRLFGVPGGERTLAAYSERSPLAEGWQERVELYQLAPLLVHALLFGGSYVHDVERIAKRFG
ncbi:MAG TPA: fructosamine kinase family protein [Solirubrobacteraceae bacterium]